MSDDGGHWIDQQQSPFRSSMSVGPSRKLVRISRRGEVGVVARIDRLLAKQPLFRVGAQGATDAVSTVLQTASGIAPVPRLLTVARIVENIAQPLLNLSNTRCAATSIVCDGFLLISQIYRYAETRRINSLTIAACSKNDRGGERERGRGRTSPRVPEKLKRKIMNSRRTCLRLSKCTRPLALFIRARLLYRLLKEIDISMTRRVKLKYAFLYQSQISDDPKAYEDCRV